MIDNKPAHDARQERVELALAKQLARSMKLNARLQASNSLLRKAVENINAAANSGRVCDKGDAQYDHTISLRDFCEQVLQQDDKMRLTQNEISGGA